MFPAHAILTLATRETAQLVDFGRHLEHLGIQSTEAEASRPGDLLHSHSPELSDRLRSFLLTRLTSRPYVALVQGVPLSVSPFIQLAITALVGRPLTGLPTPKASIVHELRPSTDATADERIINESLHTDGTATASPNRYTLLGCLTPDQNGGGHSLSVDIDTIIERCPRDLLHRVLDTPMPWLIRTVEREALIWDPILSSRPRKLRWMLYTIQSACHRFGCDTIPSLKLAHAFEAYAESLTPIIRTALATGELLAINNTMTLHARTPVLERMNSGRRVLRTKAG